MTYHCCDELRRDAVRGSALNGIDYLEVSDDQLTLFVHLLHAAPGFGPANVRIEGGERVRQIHVDSVTQQGTSEVYAVALDRYGDFSPYRLRLVRSATDATEILGFDPRLSEITFDFKVACPSPFDCKTRCACPVEANPFPGIDYLAKDYASFRRLILDRITQLVPDWTERSAADLGVTLAELIAYVGDHLSYRQDAIATEAYLQTARLRTSLKRHALLVDYRMHDGCNARTWMHVTVSAGVGPLALPKPAMRFLTRVPGLGDRVAPGSAGENDALRARPVVFEPMHDATLYGDHNLIDLYAWGDRQCCLPKGATQVTLAGHLPHLAAGDALLFEEVLGPLTGEDRDADPDHRQVVRLTAVHAFSPDDAAKPREDPLNHDLITEIEWFSEDALRFPLCLSSMTDADHGSQYIDHVSVARGNMVLADHGGTIAADEDLGVVPDPRLHYPPDRDACRCGNRGIKAIPPRFRPLLAQGPLTFAATVPTSGAELSASTSPLFFDPAAPAAFAITRPLEGTRPAFLQVKGSLEGVSQPWETRRDLLSSGEDDAHVVAEVEHDGSARLRFGDGVHGRRPQAGTAFTARYRIGNGAAGNVGAEALVHVVAADADVLSVRNPIPARGGVDMEDDAVVRRRAPHAFRRLERAVTREDSEEVTQRHAGIQRAAASLRWTGSWHTVFISVDRFGGIDLDPAFEKDLGRYVDRYRMAGHDLEFNTPFHVSLEIELLVCVGRDYFRGNVAEGILEVLSNRTLPDGTLGFFHPDRLTFGQTVYLSQVLTAARGVAGVESVQATVFRRQGDDDPGPLQRGFLALSRLEIARLDNDPNYPEHGALRLRLYGGK